MTDKKADDELRTAIGAVLFNASNFPERVQSRLLGQDMAPLIDKVTAAVRAAGFEKAPEPEWEYGISWDKNYPVFVDEEHDEDRIRRLAAVKGDRLLRRRVGPWVPAEEEQG